jgi:methylmalonyl-CoA mutase N-terminal domain/subunit
MNLFEEVAKYRALRRVWAKLMKERFGAKKPASLWFRVGPGTGGSTLTAQQAENNIVRVTLEALAAILGGVQYLHTSSFDEGHGIPTQEAVTIALRTQQILAYESGVTDVVDPLGGSYYIEVLTDRIEREVIDYINQIEARGGIIKATESGWVQKEIARSSYLKQKEIAEGQRIIVGINKFASDEKISFEIHRRDPKAAEEMKKRLEKLRRERDNSAVKRCLAEIGKVAKGKDNLTPVVLNAVRNYATIGEICGVLKGVFGEYQSPAFEA